MISKFVSNLSAKERRVFYVAALFVTLALLDRLFISPILAHVDRLDEEIEAEKISILRDKRVLDYKDKIEKESKVFEPYFSKSIPDDDVVNASFLSQVERLATKSKVSLVKSNPSHLEKNEKYNMYYANVDCHGTLEDVISFMHNINTTDELLKIVKFNLTPRRGAENEVKSSMLIVKLIVQ